VAGVLDHVRSEKNHIHTCLCTHCMLLYVIKKRKLSTSSRGEVVDNLATVS